MYNDPYNGTQPDGGQGNLARKFLTSPLNPLDDFFMLSNPLGGLAQMYTMNPWWWSSKTGMFVPGVGKLVNEKGWKEIWPTAKNFLKKVYYAGGKFTPIRGTLNTSWQVGARVVTSGMYGGENVGRKFLSRKFKDSIERRHRVIARYEQRIGDYGLNIEKLKSTLVVNSSNYKGFGASHARWKVAADANLEAKLGIETYESLIIDEKKKISGLESRINSLKVLARKQSLFKWGMRVGRVASTATLLLFMGRIAGAIGGAIGHNVLRTVDNTITQWQNRFLPEMGGHLRADYLSYGAATERQRAVQAISKAYINGRSAFGQESLYMH